MDTKGYNMPSFTDDMRELAPRLNDAVTRSFWLTSKSCGCPLTQLAFEKKLMTQEDIVEPNRAPVILSRMSDYYRIDEGELVTFTSAYDAYAAQHFNEYAYAGERIGLNMYVDGIVLYLDSKKLIMQAIEAGIEAVKQGTP